MYILPPTTLAVLVAYLSHDQRTLRVEQRALQRSLLCEDFLCAQSKVETLIAKVKHEDGLNLGESKLFLFGKIADPGKKDFGSTPIFFLNDLIRTFSRLFSTLNPLLRCTIHSNHNKDHLGSRYK